jgi:hypothetical protein
MPKSHRFLMEQVLCRYFFANPNFSIRYLI